MDDGTHDADVIASGREPREPRERTRRRPGCCPAEAESLPLPGLEGKRITVRWDG